VKRLADPPKDVFPDDLDGIPRVQDHASGRDGDRWRLAPPDAMNGGGCRWWCLNACSSVSR